MSNIEILVVENKKIQFFLSMYMYWFFSKNHKLKMENPRLISM